MTTTTIYLRFAHRLCGGLLALAAFSAPAFAQNLVVNSTFDSNLNDWELFTGFGIMHAWSPVDAAANPGSGSFNGTLPASSTFRVPPYASQCVPVAPNRDYIFGAVALLPSATAPANSRARLGIEFFDIDGCAGGTSVAEYSPWVSDIGAWTRTAGEFRTGPTVRSVYLLLYVSAPTGVLLSSHFDDVFLMLRPLLRDGFEALPMAPDQE